MKTHFAGTIRRDITCPRCKTIIYIQVINKYGGISFMPMAGKLSDYYESEDVFKCNKCEFRISGLSQYIFFRNLFEEKE